MGGGSDEKAKEAENVRGSSGDYADHLETSVGLQVSLLHYTSISQAKIL